LRKVRRDQVAPDSSFPKVARTIFARRRTFAKYVADATDNKFQIQTFAAGEIVPACRRSMREFGDRRDRADAALFSTSARSRRWPMRRGRAFGMNHRHQHSWWTFGGRRRALQ